jgi:uncharacterized protein (TIGR02231 family)
VAVTVYPDQARVTRRGHIALAAGQTRLQVMDLPQTLLPESIQAHCIGATSAQLQGVIVEPMAVAPVDDHPWRDRIPALEDRFREVKDHIAALTLNREHLQSLSVQAAQQFAQGLAQGTTQLDGISNFLTYLETTYTQLGREINQQERLKLSLDHQLQEARQRLQAAQTDVPVPRYQIEMPVWAAQATTLDLEITYGVTEATWAPAYDVRFGDDPDRLGLDYWATVQQATGEDWSAISLKLSTAAPDKSPMLPEPETWYITLSQQPRPPAAPVGRPRSPILQDTYRMLGAVPGSEIPQPDSDLEQKGHHLAAAIAVVSFQAPQAVTVLGNNSPHRVTLGQGHFPCQFTYVSLPQRCDAPYLQAQMTNPEEGVPLLPGIAHLYRQGGYIGQERFDYVAPGQSFQLSLGLDERLQVQRELVQRQTTTTDQCHITLAYRLSFHNPLPHPVTMTVMEQMPISRSEQIEIQLQAAQPAISHHKAGVCHWCLTLPAEETRHVQYSYDIIHPCDRPVLGLDV